MKRPGLTLHLAAATLFLAGLRAEDTKPVAPAPAPARPMGAMKGRRDADLVKRFDKNGDGRLDDDERAEAKEAMFKEQMDRQTARAAALGGTEQERAKMLELFDKNKDGRLDDDERAAAEKFGRERAANLPAAGGAVRAEMIRRLDKNGDGKLDDAERGAGIQFIAANLAQFPGVKQRFDRNADGKLDDAEQAALDEGLRTFAQSPVPAGRPGRGAGPLPSFDSLPPAMREQAVKRFDKDGDGKLAGEELAAMQAEMTRRRAERMAQNGGAAATGKAEEPHMADPEEAAKLDKAFDDFAPKPKPAAK
jgi:Ca2+-binding EF-hand superfamily protein